MKQLVVYDEQGYVLYRVPTPGTYKTVELDVPEGKNLDRVDTSKDPVEGIFSDILGTELVQELEAAKKQIDRTEASLIELTNFVMNGGSE